ncbi:hypothetical protein ACJJIG_20875 [Microbulbifer sp. SSSA007]|uniref:hypothetical protein n=1 Tax=Microbulbifer sp. SSSA007 TaxID=3243379 RepID=UPI004039ECAC
MEDVLMIPGLIRCLRTVFLFNFFSASIFFNVAIAESIIDPPKNPFLADSPWPMSHRNPYNQGSSYLKGIELDDIASLQKELSETIPVPIILAYSPIYEVNGKRVVWGSTLGSVFKMDMSGNQINRIDTKLKDEMTGGLSGAYVLVDKDYKFYVPDGSSLLVYGDAIKGDPGSGINLYKKFDIPEELLTAESEVIVGMNMTYDGYICLATSKGLVLVINRSLDKFYHTKVDEGEEVSNSISIDEEGGIYVVSSKKMYRFQWYGDRVSADEGKGAWKAAYEAGGETPWPGRLGIGSGSTPTLMNAGNDKLVVFTDGQELMNLVVMWRDQIPMDWKPISEEKDRRIAAEIPITFGNPNATRSISEQSVLVRGDRAVVVNNDYGWDFSRLPGVPQRLTVLFSNFPENAPYGIEQFHWNSYSRSLSSLWANKEISCPNGVPTMSESSNLVYCWGQRQGMWTLEAVNWDTGDSVFHIPLGYREKYNSVYSAAQIGGKGEIVSGTFGGVVRLQTSKY